jgi:sulfate adenylyltransferase subunit 1
MIVKSSEVPAAVKQIEATVCWMAEAPMDRARTYLIRHTTRDSKAKLAAIDHRLDVNTLEKVTAEKLAMNDIAQVTFKLAQPLFADPYLENRVPALSSSLMKATTTRSARG